MRAMDAEIIAERKRMEERGEKSKGTGAAMTSVVPVAGLVMARFHIAGISVFRFHSDFPLFQS